MTDILMRRQRRFVPAVASLEDRALPAPLVLVALIDTGYGAPGVPRAPWVEAGLNFLGPTVTTNAYDTEGYGGHGDVTANLYASTLAHLGIDAHIVPLVAAGPTTGPLLQFVPVSYTSTAIGRAELWVAQQQAMMRAQGRDVQWIVALPAAPHAITSAAEVYGRRALDAMGVPLIQAAFNGLGYSPSVLFDRSATSIVAQAAGASGEGTFSVFASVPSGYGSSGAVVVTAAWLTADIEAHPGWPAAWWVFDVSHRGVLGA